jgi:LPPG:FO 2-phospho-L-lactate transferase
VLRTARLASGARLSAITADVARAWDIRTMVLPMSDEAVATQLETDEGALAFQTYFVQRRCQPKVQRIGFLGADRAQPAPGVVEVLRDRATRAILIAPSNPYLSIDPILAVPGIKAALREASAPIVAVSPLVGGKAVKGPTAKLMGELGIAVTPASIAAHYDGLIDALLIDERDETRGVEIRHAKTDTLMTTLADRARVAEAALKLAS